MSEPMQPIVIEQTVAALPEAAWTALTEPEKMRLWFFEQIDAFEPRPGFETRFTVRSGGRDFIHCWKILESVPGKKLAIDWRYEGIPGAAVVTFEMIAGARGTLVRVTNTGLESFPRDIPEFSEESCRGGWRYFIQGRLKEYLERSGDKESAEEFMG
jgi:uncharacterized protein YndB with AHSA1/START domain